jgi:hypothetical protein
MGEAGDRSREVRARQGDLPCPSRGDAVKRIVPRDMALASPEFEALAEQLVRQQGRRARAHCGFLAGARKSVDLVAISLRARELAEPDQLSAVLEALASATPSERTSLRRLALALLEEAVAQGNAASQSSALQRLGTAQVSVEYELIALPDGMRERRVCLDRKRRTGLARGESRALEPMATAQAEGVERRLSVRSRAGLGEESAYAALLGLDLDALSSASELLLRQTRDAAQDLCAYRLRRARVDAGGGGAGHDLEVALELLDLREHLSPTAAVRLSEQLARDLALEPSAQGKISLDAELRGGRFPGLCVGIFGLDELAVVSAPLESPVDVERLVRGRGEALHRASIDSGCDDLERGVLDPALPRATGLLFARTLTEPAWIRRALRLPSRPSQELSQAFGLRALMELRGAAARFLFARELERAGPSPRLRELYRERMGQAHFVDVPADGAWDSALSLAGAELWAHAIAHSLADAMLDNFNEDWWRNPHAAELLRAFWSPGGGVELESVLGRPPALDKLGADAIARAAR